MVNCCIIAHVDNVYYSNGWAELCFNHVMNGIITEYPLSVCRYLFEKPNKIKDIVLSGLQERFRFDDTFRIPQEAYDDYNSFKFFFDSLQLFDGEESFRRVVGMLLGKNVKGTDGHFPHESVRKLLEEYDSRELDRIIAASFEGVYGVRAVVDGKTQRKMAKDYFDLVTKLQMDYPYAAYVSRLISKEYEKEANRDYVYSEVMLN